MLAIISQSVAAEDRRPLTDEEIQNAGAVRTTQGIIHVLDLASRAGIISGYLYDFGSATEEDPVQVKMYNSDYGALELLRPGMRVEVVYGEEGNVRLAIRVQQLADQDLLED